MPHVVEESILRPTSDSMRGIYLTLLRIAVSYTPPTRPISPEYLEFSVQNMLLFYQIRSITPRLGCKTPFRLCNLLIPDAKQTRYFLSAFINFIKFRTDEEIFSEHLNDERECTVFQEEFQKVKSELDIIRCDIQKMAEKKETRRPVIEEKIAKIAQLKTAKSNLEATNSALATETAKMTEEIDTLEKQKNSLEGQICDLQRQNESLEEQITSPNDSKGALKRAQDCLETEKFRHLEAELNFKELAKQTKSTKDVFEMIKTAKLELEMLNYSKIQWSETKKRVKGKEEALKAISREVELQGMKVTAAQRVQVTESGQMQRDRESAEARLQGVTNLMVAKKEEMTQLKANLQQLNEESLRLRQAIQAQETRMASEEDLHMRRIVRYENMQRDIKAEMKLLVVSLDRTRNSVRDLLQN